MSNSEIKISLEALEPLVDRLLTGSANTKEVAKVLADWGYPAPLDQTEQLRLALSLLECHDDVKRSRAIRQEAKPEAKAGTRAKANASTKAVSRSREADFSP